jgi:enoyl-CoA hydratase/carnithine racemase
VTFQTLLFEKTEDIAWITLNRPEVLNAYNIRMRDELYEVLTAIRDDDEVRAVVLRGAGRAFCAGADLTEFGTAPSPTQARSIRFARDVWEVLHDLPAPTLASLHGFVFGSGLEMSLFCDIRLAAASTKFAMPEVRLGLIPAAGGTQMLPRACGLGRATELLLTGRQFDAHEAARYGIASRVVADDQLAAATEALAHEMAGLDPAAAAAVREAVRAATDLPLHEGLRAEARLAESLSKSGK